MVPSGGGEGGGGGDSSPPPHRSVTFLNPLSSHSASPVPAPAALSGRARPAASDPPNRPPAKRPRKNQLPAPSPASSFQPYAAPDSPPGSLLTSSSSSGLPSLPARVNPPRRRQSDQLRVSQSRSDFESESSESDPQHLASSSVALPPVPPISQSSIPQATAANGPRRASGPDKRKVDSVACDLRTKTFLEMLQRYSQDVFSNFETQFTREANMDSGSESTDVMIGQEEPETVKGRRINETAASVESKFDFGLMSKDERETALRKMYEDVESSEEKLFAAHQHYLGQADVVSVTESQVRELKFIEELQELQRNKQVELYEQRVEMRRQLRMEEILKFDTMRQKMKMHEQLDLMRRNNFGMTQMRKILEHKRHLFSLWSKNLEKRQIEERKHLLECQKRKRKGRHALFAVNLKNLSPDEQKQLQKEFVIEEQHQKMLNYKMLQYLDELHKIHRTFASKKFEQEIQLLEAEQLLSLEHEKQVGETLIYQSETLLRKLSEIENLKFDLEDSYMKIGHYQSIMQLRMQQMKMNQEAKELHDRQLQSTSVFQCDIMGPGADIDQIKSSMLQGSLSSPTEMANGNPAAPSERRSSDTAGIPDWQLQSIWTRSLFCHDINAYIHADSLFRMSKDLNSFESSSSASFSDVMSESSYDEVIDAATLSFAVDIDDSGLKRQLSRERRKLLHLRSEYETSVHNLDQLKTRYVQNIKDLKAKHRKELRRFCTEKINIISQLLVAKELELQQLVKQHNRERMSLSSLHQKEVENLKMLQKKEEDLRKKAQEMEAVMEGMLDPMIVADEFGRISSANAAALSIFGYTHEEMLGQNVSIIVDPKIAHLHNSFLQRYRETRAPRIIGTTGREVVGIKKNGDLVPLHLSVSESDVNGRRIFIGCLHDLSDTKQRERLLQRARDEAAAASQAKSRFLAQMSHEIRTPLHAMLGFSELLEEQESSSSGNLTHDQKDMLSSIRQCGSVLLSILNDILNYSRYDSGEFELKEASFNLFDAVELCVANAFIPAKTKHLYLYHYFDKSLPETVFGDQSRLQQLLSHLLVNAVKFTNKGGITLMVSAESIADDPKRAKIVFHIVDTGIGIPELTKNQLFDKFSRQSVAQDSGAGLGLALCKKIAEKLCGKVELESSIVGEGSTFRVEVVLQVPGDEPQKNDLNLSKSALITVERLKGMGNALPMICCVTSNELEKKFLTSILTFLNFKFHVFTVFEECLSWVQKQVKGSTPNPQNGNPYSKYVVLFGLEAFQSGKGSLTANAVGKEIPCVIMLPPDSGVTIWNPQFAVDDPALCGRSTQKGFPENFSRIFLPLKIRTLCDTLLRAAGVDLNQLLSQSASASERAKLRVLVVEDNRVNQKVLIRMLNSLDVQPVAVLDDGSKSVNFYEKLVADLKAGSLKEKIDLILMDIQMPVMDGETAMKKIRAMLSDPMYPDAAVLMPLIVAVTANVSDSGKKDLLDSGFDACLIKPLSREDLALCIDAAISFRKTS